MKLLDVEYIDGVKEETYHDPDTDKTIIHRSADVEAHLDAIKRERESKTRSEQYKGNLVKACSVDEIIIEKMKNGQCCPEGKTYNFMSQDRDEFRRALLHIQGCHPRYITVDGKPFAKERKSWH